VCSGTSPDDRLVEVIELEDHPFFVASQFHPEFKSRPNRPEPLFRDFVGAALTRSRERPAAEKSQLEAPAPETARTSAERAR
jgi:CTP synthase